VREEVLSKTGCAQSMCCVHLGKCTHCTVLRALGLVCGNDLKVHNTELYIYVCMILYVLRLESLYDYEAGEPGCR
jgi:hypothetical protein